jgi:DNA-binding response OmpR family regulator
MTRKMLVVDDEETIRWALRELFMQDGWEVHCAEDGREATELIGRHIYRFIITDLKMPGCSGVEVIRKARRRCADTGVLVLTGYASLETAIEAVRLRAWDYVTKPCQVDYLKERVDAHLEATTEESSKASEPDEPDESTLRAFVAGGGTQLFELDLEQSKQSHRLLKEIKRVCSDLGIEEERTARLVQGMVEAFAGLGSGETKLRGRVGLVEGHFFVGISTPSNGCEAMCPLDCVAETLGVYARFVQWNGRDSIVLSERV